MEPKKEYSHAQLKQLLDEFGKRLRKLRIEKGYSNYELFAYDNNFSRTQYGRYEKGQDLRFTSLLRLLNALDISLVDFFKEFEQSAFEAVDDDDPKKLEYKQESTINQTAEGQDPYHTKDSEKDK